MKSAGSEQPDDTTFGLLDVDDTEPTEAGPLTTSIVWATWALFAGLALLLSGAGLFATVVGIRSETEQFPTVAIGLIVASYYLGFLFGSRLTLVVLGTVGHIRAYTALASALSAVILGAGTLVHPASWVVLRFAAGACLAGQYVVAESWLNHIVTNATRARILSIYSMVSVVAYGVGQLSVSVIDPNTLVAFALASALISLAVCPVALSEEAAPPILARPTRMQLRELMSIAPTGVITSVLVGMAHGAFLGLAAVYATRAGLSHAEIGVFVAMPTVGSLLLQVPISSASDEVDRRVVGAITAFLCAGAALVLLLAGPNSWIGFAAMIAIGGTTFPLYSIAGAYTNDWVPTQQLTAAASQLVVLYGAGAFVGPFIASVALDVGGVDGFVWTTIVLHAVISVFLAVRVAQWHPSVRANADNDLALSSRLFLLPVTAVAMGRRVRIPLRRRARKG